MLTADESRATSRITLSPIRGPDSRAEERRDLYEEPVVETREIVRRIEHRIVERRSPATVERQDSDVDISHKPFALRRQHIIRQLEAHSSHVS